MLGFCRRIDSLRVYWIKSAVSMSIIVRLERTHQRSPLTYVATSIRSRRQEHGCIFIHARPPIIECSLVQPTKAHSITHTIRLLLLRISHIIRGVDDVHTRNRAKTRGLVLRASAQRLLAHVPSRPSFPEVVFHKNNRFNLRTTFYHPRNKSSAQTNSTRSPVETNQHNSKPSQHGQSSSEDNNGGAANSSSYAISRGTTFNVGQGAASNGGGGGGSANLQPTAFPFSSSAASSWAHMPRNEQKLQKMARQSLLHELWQTQQRTHEGAVDW